MKKIILLVALAMICLLVAPVFSAPANNGPSYADSARGGHGQGGCGNQLGSGACDGTGPGGNLLCTCPYEGCVCDGTGPKRGGSCNRC